MHVSLYTFFFYFTIKLTPNPSLICMSSLCIQKYPIEPSAVVDICDSGMLSLGTTSHM